MTYQQTKNECGPVPPVPIWSCGVAPGDNCGSRRSHRTHPEQGRTHATNDNLDRMRRSPNAVSDTVTGGDEIATPDPRVSGCDLRRPGGHRVIGVKSRLPTNVGRGALAANGSTSAFSTLLNTRKMFDRG